MELRQALRLASLLIDFELEQPQVQPPPMGWVAELRSAKQTISRAIERPTDAFFISAVVKRRPGRSSRY